MLKTKAVLAKTLAVVLTLTASAAYGEPLRSCKNVGSSAGDYQISGRVHRITSSDTIADVNALDLSPGDAVLFRAGNTWNIRNENSRLRAKKGVLYGRYGPGPNPLIVGAGVSFSLGFRGVIEADGVDDVIIDGIDVRYSSSFGIMIRNFDNVTVSNLTVSNTDGGGIVFIGNPRGTRATLHGVEVFAADGRPHESIAFDNVDGFTVSNVRAHKNGHAAINLKGNSRNGEVYGSEFSQTGNDPTFYLERAENIHVHDNWIHTNADSTTRKALLSLGIEPFGDEAEHYIRNVEINNNVIENSHRIGINFFLKETISNDPSRAERIYDNIHIHHNAIVSTGKEGLSWSSAIQGADNRTPPDPKDWGGILIENNAIWDTGTADGISFNHGIDRAFTIRYNLFQSGESGDLGSNAVRTRTSPFANVANKNFDPAGPALGAGRNGSDIGARIRWTCESFAPTGSSRPKPPTLFAE